MQNTTTKSQLLESKLRQNGYKVTKTKRDIFNILLNSNKPLSIKEISTQIVSSHFVSIYRSVDIMQKSEIIKLVPQGFKNLFELSDTFKPHHHHTTCEKCGLTKEIRSENLETILSQIALDYGFRPTIHHFELFGVCKSCDKSR
jgi:Fe2+ or Zn2+ uptake regulation protein